MTEEWSRWIPNEQVSARYSLDMIIENNDGLTIQLLDDHNENMQMRLEFRYAADAYRSTYETFRAELIHYLDQKYGTVFYSEWTFFKVQNSSYIQWFSEQSGGISDFSPYTHFSILLMDSVIDILSLQEPKIELLDLSICDIK